MDKTPSNQAVQNFVPGYVQTINLWNLSVSIEMVSHALDHATISVPHLTVNRTLTTPSSRSRKTTSRDNPGLRPKLPVPDDPKFTMSRFTSPGNEREALGFRQTQTGAQSTARMAEKIKPLDKILRPN